MKDKLIILIIFLFGCSEHREDRPLGKYHNFIYEEMSIETSIELLEKHRFIYKPNWHFEDNFQYEGNWKIIDDSLMLQSEIFKSDGRIPTTEKTNRKFAFLFKDSLITSSYDVFVKVKSKDDYKLKKKIFLKNYQPKVKEVKARNILNVFINLDGSVLINSKRTKIDSCSFGIINFIRSSPTDSMFPEFVDKKINNLGIRNIPTGVISLQYTKGVEYEDFIKVQDLILRCYTKYRNEISIKEFGVSYDSLLKLDDNKKEIIIDMCPIRILESIPIE